MAIKLGMFNYAMDAVEKALEAREDYGKSYAWRAVIRASNQCSSCEELQMALKDISVAIDKEKAQNNRNKKENLDKYRVIKEKIIEKQNRRNT